MDRQEGAVLPAAHLMENHMIPGSQPTGEVTAGGGVMLGKSNLNHHHHPHHHADHVVKQTVGAATYQNQTVNHIGHSNKASNFVDVNKGRDGGIPHRFPEQHGMVGINKQRGGIHFGPPQQQQQVAMANMGYHGNHIMHSPDMMQGYNENLQQQLSPHNPHPHHHHHHMMQQQQQQQHMQMQQQHHLAAGRIGGAGGNVPQNNPYRYLKQQNFISDPSMHSNKHNLLPQQQQQQQHRPHSHNPTFQQQQQHHQQHPQQHPQTFNNQFYMSQQWANSKGGRQLPSNMMMEANHHSGPPPQQHHPQNVQYMIHSNVNVDSDKHKKICDSNMLATSTNCTAQHPSAMGGQHWDPSLPVGKNFEVSVSRSDQVLVSSTPASSLPNLSVLPGGVVSSDSGTTSATGVSDNRTVTTSCLINQSLCSSALLPPSSSSTASSLSSVLVKMTGPDQDCQKHSESPPDGQSRLSSVTLTVMSSSVLTNMASNCNAVAVSSTLSTPLSQYVVAGHHTNSTEMCVTAVSANTGVQVAATVQDSTPHTHHRSPLKTSLSPSMSQATVLPLATSAHSGTGLLTMTSSVIPLQTSCPPRTALWSLNNDVTICTPSVNTPVTMVMVTSGGNSSTGSISSSVHSTPVVTTTSERTDAVIGARIKCEISTSGGNHGNAIPAGGTVTVPFAWRRVLENNAVVYYSPSSAKLSSFQHIRQYLQTEGTCKCGLECPLLVEKVFNFDPSVISKQWSTEDGLKNSMTELCIHKRKIIAMATLQSSAALQMSLPDSADMIKEQRHDSKILNRKESTTVKKKKVPTATLR